MFGVLLKGKHAGSGFQNLPAQENKLNSFDKLSRYIVLINRIKRKVCC
jgi:hypothetical protein